MSDDELDAIYCRAYEAARKPGDDIVQDHKAHIAGLRAVMEAAAKICEQMVDLDAPVTMTTTYECCHECAAAIRGAVRDGVTPLGGAMPPVDVEYRRATPAENMTILKARLSEHLSLAEKRELDEAAALLRTISESGE